MAKKVISLRLTTEQLTHLDDVCAKLRMNRSEAITAAVVLLAKHVGDDEKVVNRDNYLSVPWMKDDD